MHNRSNDWGIVRPTGADVLTDAITSLDGSHHAICVVGAGPVGLALATTLTRRGIRVLLLESGGKTADSKIQELAGGALVDPAKHDDLMIATARRLGGSSNLWGGRSMPYDPVDFVPRDWVDGQWPIPYAELMRWFPSASVATCGGAAVYDAALLPLAANDPAFTANKIERGVNIQQAQIIHAHAIANDPLLDVRTHATLTQIDYAENGRVKDIEIVHSLSGARARVTVDTLVLAAGGLETTRILLASRRDSPERFGGEAGPLGRYYMGHVIGEIADIVFAEERYVDAFDYHIDAHGSYTRRRVMASEVTQIDNRLLNGSYWPVVPPVADARHKSAILSSVYMALALRPIGRLLAADAIRTRHVPPGGVPLAPHLVNLLTGVPSAIAFTSRFLRNRYGSSARIPGFFVRNRLRRYGWSYHAEHAPNSESRVVLTPRLDRLGLPQLQIDLRFAQADADSVVKTHDLMEDWLARTGMGRLEYRMAREERSAAVLDLAAHGTHQIGLARMGKDRRSGVVDANLATFDAPNLFIASTAVLPTSGQANPTVSTVALALRLADHISAAMGKECLALIGRRIQQ